MAVSPANPTLPAPPASSEGIQCAQVYGGIGITTVPIELPGLDGYLYSDPCGSAHGGDIHYLSICGSGLLSRFCLADVVGHGEEVATVSAETHMLLRKAVDWTDHRRMLEMLNRSLYDKGLEALTTAAVFTYFPATRNLTYSYAGHPRGWHWSAARRRWSELCLTESERAEGSMGPGRLDPDDDDVRDLPLAVTEETTYSRARMRPAVGDVIVITTDGVTDAPGPDGARLGAEGLGAMLTTLDVHEPRAIVDGLVERLAAYCGVTERGPGGPVFTHDDVTILALRIQPYSKFAAMREMFANRVARHVRRRGSQKSGAR
jgi:hypothetical protein